MGFVWWGAQRNMSHTFMINSLKVKHPKNGCAWNDTFVSFSVLCVCVDILYFIGVVSFGQGVRNMTRTLYLNGPEVQEWRLSHQKHSGTAWSEQTAYYSYHSQSSTNPECVSEMSKCMSAAEDVSTVPRHTKWWILYIYIYIDVRSRFCKDMIQIIINLMLTVDAFQLVTIIVLEVKINYCDLYLQFKLVSEQKKMLFTS